jgi:preprotein translocase subunit SecG
MLILKIVLWVLMFAAALLLGLVILLQEGKGGGLAEAFGGMGAETFGVKSGGINKFTFALAGVFMGSAVLLHALWNT